MPKDTVHIPVLLKETIEILAVKDEDVVLDATVGGGGHSEELLKTANIKLIGLDADPAAIARVGWRLASYGERVQLAPSNFRVVGSVLEKLQVEHVDKALFDLGLSSDELEVSGRGFSLQKNEPLQMTFDPMQLLSARDLLTHLSREELTNILRNYGEEKYAWAIAGAVIEAREREPIETTTQLVEIIKGAVPKSYLKGKIHPATKTFQALRIAVNDELDSLKQGLAGVWEKLAPGGRLAVISFHSIEDRIVKVFMKEKVDQGEGSLLTRKPITASEAEVQANPRSRSAKLRGIQKND